MPLPVLALLALAQAGPLLPGKPGPSRSRASEEAARAQASDESEASQTEIVVYGASWCAPCHMVKNWLSQRELSYRYVDIDTAGYASLERAVEAAGSASPDGIPVIIIGGNQVVVGFDADGIRKAVDAAAAAETAPRHR